MHPLGLSHENCRKCRNARHRANGGSGDAGFTLIELLIVTVVLPLIIGALALGIVAVFKLQSSVSSRLGDSADSQQVSAYFSKDIVGAAYVTTDPTSSPQCGAGTGTQLLGVETNEDASDGEFATTISYVRVQVGSGSNATYDLDRLVCNGEGDTTPQVTMTLAYDFSSSASAQVVCAPSATTAECTTSLAATQWIATLGVSEISLPVIEPSSTYSYTLNASPVSNVAATMTGSPISSVTSSTCEAPGANTGPLSANLCFADLSELNNPANMDQATGGGCLEMSVSVGQGDTLYFCISISGNAVVPSVLPTYSQAFLGNTYCVTSTDCLPFYSGVGGEPALYQAAHTTPNDTTVTFSNIEVEDAAGQAATGWEFLSADAESTDASGSSGESITWTAGFPGGDTNTGLYPVCNDESWDSCTTKDSYGNYDYFGNSCLNDQPTSGVVQVNANEIECNGYMPSENGNPAEDVTAGAKDGAAMVEALQPSSMTITMSSPYGGLEAIAVGLLVSGVSSS